MVMGIMPLPNADKALSHLYRTLKPGGTCVITSWYRLQYHDLGLEILKRLRGEDAYYDIDASKWKAEWLDPQYLKTQMERAGFKDCRVETILEYSRYESLEYAAKVMPKVSGMLVKFKEGEEELWGKYWEESLRKYCLAGDGTVNMKMSANIGCSTK